jgi:uncharacterized metal-binding protein YceD (DUF177 family)
MSAPEFSRPIRAHEVGQPKQHNIGADTAERTALAQRFDLLSLDRLEATLTIARTDATFTITGRISAAGTQPCARTRTPVPFTIAEDLKLRLIPNAPQGEDLELGEDDLDAEPLTSDIIDLGEYTAQALGLALDPYPRSTEPSPHILTEEQARAASSPFAVLKKP